MLATRPASSYRPQLLVIDLAAHADPGHGPAVQVPHATTAASNRIPAYRACTSAHQASAARSPASAARRAFSLIEAWTTLTDLE